MAPRWVTWPSNGCPKEAKRLQIGARILPQCRPNPVFCEGNSASKKRHRNLTMAMHRHHLAKKFIPKGSQMAPRAILQEPSLQARCPPMSSKHCILRVQIEVPQIAHLATPRLQFRTASGKDAGKASQNCRKGSKKEPPRSPKGAKKAQKCAPAPHEKTEQNAMHIFYHFF